MMVCYQFVFFSDSRQNTRFQWFCNGHTMLPCLSVNTFVIVAENVRYYVEIVREKMEARNSKNGWTRKRVVAKYKRTRQIDETLST